jgi:3-dehydroquinate synthetase
MSLTLTRPVALDRQIVCGGYSFEYFVRSGAWPEFLERLEALQADRYVIVTDEAFPRALAEGARRHIASLGSCTLLTIPVGETAKRISTIEELSVRAEEEAGITVASVVIALGGGLVANVAGYWAASQFRGIRLVQVPTTLLSMADVMPSLKQGVNTSRGKNHLGTYYAPTFVWNDLAYLQYLPTLEIRAALCEMIKFILTISPQDPQVYEEACLALHENGQYTQEQYLQFVKLCVDAKCSVLQDDPFEQGEGMIFEYGHTVGHALELLSCVGRHNSIPHGLAIGLGMLVAARISRELGMLSVEEEEEHARLLRLNGAPTAIPAKFHTDDLLDIIRHDNKRGRLLPVPDGMHNMVLLRHLGMPNRTGGTVLTQVKEKLVRAAIEAYRQ